MVHYDYKDKVKSFILHISKKICTLYDFSLSEGKKILNNYANILFKIFILFIIILIGFFSCSISKKTVLNNIADIFSISDDIRIHFSDKPNYWGLSTDYILKNNIISKKYISDNKIKLRANKELNIGQGYPVKPVAPYSKIFDIVLDKLNKAECISYLETEISEANSVKLFSITVTNERTNTTYTWGDNKNPLPIKKYVGRLVCDDEHNTIIWSMY